MQQITAQTPKELVWLLEFLRDELQETISDLIEVHQSRDASIDVIQELNLDEIPRIIFQQMASDAATVRLTGPERHLQGKELYLHQTFHFIAKQLRDSHQELEEEIATKATDDFSAKWQVFHKRMAIDLAYRIGRAFFRVDHVLISESKAHEYNAEGTLEYNYNADALWEFTDRRDHFREETYELLLGIQALVDFKIDEVINILNADLVEEELSKLIALIELRVRQHFDKPYNPEPPEPEETGSHLRLV